MSASRLRRVPTKGSAYQRKLASSKTPCPHTRLRVQVDYQRAERWRVEAENNRSPARLFRVLLGRTQKCWVRFVPPLGHKLPNGQLWHMPRNRLPCSILRRKGAQNR